MVVVHIDRRAVVNEEKFIIIHLRDGGITSVAMRGQVLDVIDLQGAGVEMVERGTFLAEGIADDIAQIAPSVEETEGFGAQAVELAAPGNKIITPAMFEQPGAIAFKAVNTD